MANRQSYLLPNLTVSHWISPNLIESHQISKNLTESHQILPSLTISHNISLYLIKSHWISSLDVQNLNQCQWCLLFKRWKRHKTRTCKSKYQPSGHWDLYQSLNKWSTRPISDVSDNVSQGSVFKGNWKWMDCLEFAWHVCGDIASMVMNDDASNNARANTMHFKFRYDFPIKISHPNSLLKCFLNKVVVNYIFVQWR